MNNNSNIKASLTARITFFLGTLFVLLSCGNNSLNVSPGRTINSNIRYAGKFRIERNDSCSMITITDPWQGAENVRQVWYLVKQGAHLRNVDSAFIIKVPLKRVICTSTTHIAMVAALGEESSISAVSGARYVYNETVLKMISEGKTTDIGYDSGLNSELILKSNPDIMIMYGVGGEGEGNVSKLKEMGIKVIYDADYLEDDPLGKAEWIKLFGALFCREQAADSLFDSIEVSYNRTRNYVAVAVSNKPKVLLGLPFRDTWFISPGNSYVSRLIADAGGDYLWKNKESKVSMPYSLENVFMKSMEADFWLNTGSVNSKNELTSFDPRLKEIPAFKTDRLYNNNARMSEMGGNDYWESGTINPDIILKDIASILHPELFEGYKLVYYRKIE